MNWNNITFPKTFLIFAASTLAAIFIVENINQRFWLNDFKVYYEASRSLFEGKPVYNTLFALGSGYYKYSPFTALLFLPIALLPYSAASTLQFVFLAGVIMALFLVTGYLLNSYFFQEKLNNLNILLSVSFICVLNHLVRELHLGNINVVLLLLLSLCLLFQLQNKYLYAGALLAVVVITKPFFLLLFLPLLVRGNIKLILSSAIFILSFLLLPAILTGVNKNIELHKEWLNVIMDHNAGFPSNNTIDSLARLYLHPGLTESFQIYLLGFVLFCFVLFTGFNRYTERKITGSKTLKIRNQMLEWLLLIALMPSLFRTDTQHFLFTLPLIMILLNFVIRSKRVWAFLLFTILIFLYEGNSSDLIGRNMAKKFDEIGILGISNLILITWCVLEYYYSFKKKIILFPFRH